MSKIYLINSTKISGLNRKKSREIQPAEEFEREKDRKCSFVMFAVEKKKYDKENMRICH